MCDVGQDNLCKLLLQNGPAFVICQMGIIMLTLPNPKDLKEQVNCFLKSINFNYH